MNEDGFIRLGKILVPLMLSAPGTRANSSCTIRLPVWVHMAMAGPRTFHEKNTARSKLGQWKQSGQKQKDMPPARLELATSGLREQTLTHTNV